MVSNTIQRGFESHPGHSTFDSKESYRLAIFTRHGEHPFDSLQGSHCRAKLPTWSSTILRFAKKRSHSSAEV